MKKQEPSITQITLRDAKSSMSPAEYSVWKSKWNRF
jgi:hypothetical protein